MALNNEQELVTVTFFQSRCYDSWKSQRQFCSAPMHDLINKIKDTMKTPKNYACFCLNNGKFIALARVG